MIEHRTLPENNQRSENTIAESHSGWIDPEANGKAVRVLIAEDQPVFRAVLEDLIASEPSLQLVGSAYDADQAIELAKK